MKLTKLVLKTIKDELDAIPVDNYLYLAPESATYPFTTFFPISTVTEYTLGDTLGNVNSGHVIDRIKIQDIYLANFDDGLRAYAWTKY